VNTTVTSSIGAAPPRLIRERVSRGSAGATGLFPPLTLPFALEVMSTADRGRCYSHPFASQPEVGSLWAAAYP